MGSPLGVLKVAAARLGLTLQEWQARWAAGERWCSTCARWRLKGAFGRDRTRRAGISAICLDCRHSPAYRERGRIRAALRRETQRSRNGCDN